MIQELFGLHSQLHLIARRTAWFAIINGIPKQIIKPPVSSHQKTPSVAIRTYMSLFGCRNLSMLSALDV